MKHILKLTTIITIFTTLSFGAEDCYIDSIPLSANSSGIKMTRNISVTTGLGHFFLIKVTGDPDKTKHVVLYTTGRSDTSAILRTCNESTNIISAIDSSDNISRTNKNFKIDRLLKPGKYYLQVSREGWPNLADYRIHYTLEDHGNNIRNATKYMDWKRPMVAGNIERRGDTDYFQVIVPKKMKVTLRTLGTTDTYGSLYTSSGRLIINNDDSGKGRNFKIEQDLDRGTYYARVRHYRSSGRGGYLFNRFNKTLVNSNDYGDFHETAEYITYQQTINTRIDRAGDIDYFYILFTEAGNYTIETKGSTDTYGYFENSKGNVLRRNDDGGQGRNFKIKDYFPAGGYYIKVRHYSSTGTGNYQLKITKN